MHHNLNTHQHTTPELHIVFSLFLSQYSLYAQDCVATQLQVHRQINWWHSGAGLHLQQLWDSIHGLDEEPGVVLSGELRSTERQQNQGADGELQQ